MTDRDVELEPQPKPPTEILMDFVRSTFVGVFSHERIVDERVQEGIPKPAGKFYHRDTHTLKDMNCFRVELRPPELDPEERADIIPAQTAPTRLTASFLLPIPPHPEDEQAAKPMDIADTAPRFIIRMRYKDERNPNRHPYYVLESTPTGVRLWPLASEENIDLDAELMLMNASPDESDDGEEVGEALLQMLEAQIRSEFDAEGEDDLAAGWMRDLPRLNVFAFTKQAHVDPDDGNGQSDAA